MKKKIFFKNFPQAIPPTLNGIELWKKIHKNKTARENCMPILEFGYQQLEVRRIHQF